MHAALRTKRLALAVWCILRGAPQQGAASRPIASSGGRACAGLVERAAGSLSQLARLPLNNSALFLFIFRAGLPQPKCLKSRHAICESGNTAAMTAPATNSLFPSHLIQLGQQAIDAVRANIAQGAPLVRCQLLASDFFEAWKQELRSSVNDFDKRDLLIAAGVHCNRMRTAVITPAAMLQELQIAVEILRMEQPHAPQPTRSRPVLRVIEGGLSRAAKLAWPFFVLQTRLRCGGSSLRLRRLLPRFCVRHP